MFSRNPPQTWQTHILRLMLRTNIDCHILKHGRCRYTRTTVNSRYRRRWTQRGMPGLEYHQSGLNSMEATLVTH